MSSETNQQSSNGNGNASLKQKRKNQAVNQDRYRKRLKEKGFNQLNVLVPTRLYNDLHELLKKDEKTLQNIIKFINEKFINTEKIITNNNSLITSSQPIVNLDEKNFDHNEEESKEINIEILKPKRILFDDLFYTGDFSSKVKLLNEHYKVVGGIKIPATTKEIQKAELYIKKLTNIVEANRGVGPNKLRKILHEEGYYTLNTENEKIMPSIRGVRTIQNVLLHKTG